MSSPRGAIFDNLDDDNPPGRCGREEPVYYTRDGPMTEVIDAAVRIVTADRSMSTDKETTRSANAMLQRLFRWAEIEASVIASFDRT